MEYPKFKVCCRCFTFNQAKYITDAMNGFTMQQTSFPFVCCIVDDASTDGEQDVIRKYVDENFDFSEGSVAFHKETDYAHITYAQHKTNNNCYFAVLYLKENHYSQSKSKMGYLSEWRDMCEYEALCEGDDFWTHSGKLQMQVIFLDSHLDYGLVHTDFNLTKGKRNHKTIIFPDGKAFPDALTRGISIGTVTAMYRLSTYKLIPKYYLDKGWPMGDYPLWIELAYASKIHYLSEETACYRILEESASHSQNFRKLLNFHNSYCDIRKFYIEKFNVDEYVDIYSAIYYETIVRYACRLGQKDEARAFFSEARSQGKLTRKCVLFYWATLIPILRYVISIYIKI